jgi:AcrR family transcriptional regulator
MTTENFQRARRPEQKLERRDAILDAARELALRDGVRTVSLADIAARVGIHKSALLRYFETREQIFLDLTAQAWREWTAALRASLGAVAPGSTADGRSIALVADVLADSFGQRPLLCDLIAHTPLNLERNVSVEAVRRYKLVSLGAVDEASALVSRVLPDLTVAECTQVVSDLASLAGATWQIANPGSALTELYTSDPALVRACMEVAPRLRRTGEVLLAGLIPSRRLA